MVVVAIVAVVVDAVAMVAVGTVADTTRNKPTNNLCDQCCYMKTNKLYEPRMKDT